MQVNKLSIILITLLLTFGLTACDKGPAEEAGERIDNATEDMGDKIEDATDDAGDKVEEAGDKIEDETD